MTADELQGQLLGIIFATKKILREEMKSLVGAGIKTIEIVEISGKPFLHFVFTTSNGEKDMNVSIPGLLTDKEKESITELFSHLSLSETGNLMFNDEIVLTGEEKKEIWTGTAHELNLLTEEEKTKYNLFITTDED